MSATKMATSLRSMPLFRASEEIGLRQEVRDYGECCRLLEHARCLPLEGTHQVRVKVKSSSAGLCARRSVASNPVAKAARPAKSGTSAPVTRYAPILVAN